MARTAFITSPGKTGEQRKFINPTSGFVGANVFGPDGKPTAIAVEPGGEVWLTAEEERMTAEAPRLAQHNPFVMEWDEAVDYDSFGEPTRTVRRSGVLVLADEPARPVASDRFTPERSVTNHTIVPSGAAEMTVAELEAELALRRAEAGEPEPEKTVKGADVPQQPPVEGQPSPDEIVGTPEAVAANDAALSKRKSTKEQPTTGVIPT